MGNFGLFLSPSLSKPNHKSSTPMEHIYVRARVDYVAVFSIFLYCVQKSLTIPSKINSKIFFSKNKFSIEKFTFFMFLSKHFASLLFSAFFGTTKILV